MQVSYFFGARHTSPVFVELSDIFAEIKNGKHKKIITTCRQHIRENNKKLYNEMKKRIPCYTVSCRVDVRKDAEETLQEYSGLLQGDFDNVGEDVEELRDKLFADKHVEAAFISPSGNGVKLWIKVENDKSKHLESFKAAEKYFQEKYDLSLDSQCKDIGRLFFQSYDPDAKIKEDAVPLPINGGSDIFFDSETVPETLERDDFERVEEALKLITPDDYDVWMKTGMSVKALLGDDGFTYWDSWSRQSDKYESGEMKKMWDGFTGGAISEGNGGTLFHLAKDTFKFKTITKPPVSVRRKEAKELHKDYLKPDGFVGNLASFIDENSKYPQPILSLAASLTYCGVLIGRKARTEENTRSGLFCAGIAKTSYGKESARFMIKKLDSDAKLKCFGGEKVTSRASIERILSIRPSAIFLLDEFGLFMQAIYSVNAPKYAMEVMTAFMEIFTAQGMYYGQDKASIKEQERIEIDQPCVAIYGTSTPETFWNSLNYSKIRDGSMNRFLIFTAPEERPERRRSRIPAKFPAEILNRVEMFRNMQTNPHSRDNLPSPEPEVFNYSDEAYRVFEKLEDECIRRAEKNDATASMWGRSAEHAKKIALINCLGDNKSEINSEMAEYGCELVRILTENTCIEIDRNLSDNEFEKTSKKVERLIRDSGENGISSSELTARTRFLRNARHRKEILEDLQGANLVVLMRKEAEGRGRDREVWFAVDQTLS